MRGDEIAQAIQKDYPSLCHTERSEVSRNSKRDSSFATQTQNDKSLSTQTRNDEISKLEQEIDKLIYALYDLIQSEIQLIEK